MGVTTVYIGAVLGSTCAMLLGRFVFRETLIEKSKRFKLFRAIDKAVETEVTLFSLFMCLCVGKETCVLIETLSHSPLYST